mmetsp:Transcript_168317/g.540764  ORF Transcript_168317/g.540764 Transcript_168317/m.540764 type:complete len:274 (+) Transcript_168317:67-888(+)
MGSALAGVVFQPQPSTYDGKAWRTMDGQELEHVWVPSDRDPDNPMPGYFLKCPDDDAHFTVLFSHGNAEDLGIIRASCFEMAVILRCNFFLYEYTGYGIRAGSPSEVAVYEDIEAAYKYVRDVLEVPWQRIVAYGRSIGTAPSVHLATRAPLRGMVLQSPMSSIYRIPFHLRFTLPGDRFCNIDKVKDVCCPTLIIHGTRDEIVPCWHSQALYETFRKHQVACEAYIVDGADHNNLESQADVAFFNRLQRYLQHLRTSPVPERLQRQADNPCI